MTPESIPQSCDPHFSYVDTPVATAPPTFDDICEEMMATHERKNHDYGSSFEKTMDEFGLTAAAIRLSDKLNRFKSLMVREAQVADESIRDTLMDAASYAILTIEWLEKRKAK